MEPTVMNDTTRRNAENLEVKGESGLETRGVHAWFDKHHALADVSLHFPENTVTGLIGPSGCGKSTFLRLLNRMHEFIPKAAMAGQVLFEGNDIYADDVNAIDMRRRIGMVFQKPNPFPAMNIGENVVAGLKLSKIKSDNKDEIIEDCLTRAGLWNEVKDRLKSPGGSLSGGQQQRLCIARSLALKPDVLLLDEPCSALDPGSTLRVEETIVQLSESMTIVIVTHNMQQAARVSDYCAFFLSDGGQDTWLKPTSLRIFSRTPKTHALLIMCRVVSADFQLTDCLPKYPLSFVGWYFSS